MSRIPFIAQAHQIEMIEFMHEHPRCNIWAGMGAGKTSSAEKFLHDVELLEPGRSLVLAPKRVARSTWPGEAAKWDCLRNLSVLPVVGTEAERIAALKLDVSIHTINYDVLPWLIEWHLDNKKTWRWSRVVSDESTRLKSFRLGGRGGQRATAIARVAHTNVKRWINLTGTPSPNGLVDLWGQNWYIDAGVRLGRTVTAFRDRWFKYDQYSREYSPLEHAQDQIHAQLADVSITPTLPYSVDEPIVRPIYVDLPSKARALYREMEKKMFAEIEGHEVEAFTAAAKTIKCLQIANGAAYIDGNDGIIPAKRKWAEVHDSKLQALESIVEEAAGMPVLVAYHFKSDLERILKAFPRARFLDDNPKTEADWNAGKIPMLVAHPASAGHGLNLQDGGNILAVFGHWWDLEQYMQIIERIGPLRQKQSGHNRPVYIYPIIARDTVDEDVMYRRESKREVQDILVEAMKRRRA
jgi:SNF2 family DNA or RNA helicase